MKESLNGVTFVTGGVKRVSDQIPTTVYHVIIPS